MKILIADKLAPAVVAQLQQAGLEVAVEADLTADDLPARIAGFDILVVRSTRVTADVFAAGRQLALVVRAGAGVNTIDLQAASQQGVYVACCPGKNTAAVAELTTGLLIACDRRIVDASCSLRAGEWRKKEFSAAAGLKGRTLAIIGFGAIGRAVARCALAMEMHVAAWSRSLTPELAAEHRVEFKPSMIEAATGAYAVSIHLAMNEHTRGCIGSDIFNAMQEGGIFINTSRGEIVDTAALKSAITERSLRVGLDVFDNEPAAGPFEDTGLAAEITGTPHIGASTRQASQAIAAEVCRVVLQFVTTGQPPNVVNLIARSPATHHLVVRHYNRVGALAGVLDELREANINVEEMENIIFDGAHAACCTLRLDQAPGASVLQTLEAMPDIIHVFLEAG